MKKVLFLLCVLITSTVFGSDNKTDEKLIDDTITSTGTNLVAIASGDSSNQRFIYDGVKEFLVATASNLKVTVSHVYEVLVKQQLVYSISWMIVTIIMVLLSYFIYRIIKWLDSLPVADQPDSGGIMFFLILINIIGYIIVLFHLNTMVTGFVNPEMGAIYEIMDYIKELKGASPPPASK